MPIQDTDLFMVSRDNNTYQITAKDIKDSYYGSPIFEEDANLGSLRIEENTQGVFSHTSGTNPNNLTISFWYKPIELMASSGFVNILNFTNSDGSHSLEIAINHPVQTKLLVKHTKTGFSTTSSYFNVPMHDDTSWHHVHLVITNSDLTWYSKGRLVEKYAHTTASSLPLGTDYDMYMHDNTMQVSKGYGQIAHLTVIDGQAVLPDETGHFNKNNQWTPKKYEGAYGTNGGYWAFNHTDEDTSGNNNNITLTGLVDYSYDAPANNYVTLTAHVNSQFKNDHFIIGKGGTYLKKTGSNSVTPKAQGSYLPPTGTWYWEVTMEAMGETYNTQIGIILTGNNESSPYTTLMCYQGDGQFFDKGQTQNLGLTTWQTGDVIGVAWDADTKELSLWQNGVFKHKFNCTSFSGNLSHWDSAVPWIKIGSFQNTACDVNFGQKDWVYDPPEGCTPVNTNEILRKYDCPRIHEHVASDWNLFPNTNELNFGIVPTDVVIGSFPHLSSDFYTVNQVANVDNEQNGLFAVKLGSSQATAGKLGDFSDDNRKFVLSNYDAVVDIGVGSSTLNNAFQGLGIRAGTQNESLSVSDLNYTRSVNKELGFAVIKFTDMANSSPYNISHGLDATPHTVLVVEERSQSSSVKPWAVGSNTWDMNLSSQLSFGNAMNSLASGIALQTSNVNSNTVAYTMESTGYKNIALYLFSGNFARSGYYAGTTTEQGRHVYLGFKPKFIWFKNLNATNQLQAHARPHAIMKNDQNDTGGTAPYWTQYDWTESGKVRHWRDCSAKNPFTAISNSTSQYFEPTANGFILKSSNQALNANTIRYFAIGDTHWLHS